MGRHSPAERAPRGMTLIEIIAVIGILGILLVLFMVGIGGGASARTREGASELATAVRYTHNLAAVHNRTYALYIDLGNHTYYAAPLPAGDVCDRVLLASGADDSGSVVKTMRSIAKEEDEDDESDEDADKLQVAHGLKRGGGDGGVPGLPAWANEDSSAPGRLKRMLGFDIRTAARDQAREVGAAYDDDEASGEDEHAGDADSRRSNHKAVNMLSKEYCTKKFSKDTYPKEIQERAKHGCPLPQDVYFVGIMLREGADRIEEGVVPIVIYPHGYIQRALVFIEGGYKGDEERFTVETLTMRGRARWHGRWLEPIDFREEVD